MVIVALGAMTSKLEIASIDSKNNIRDFCPEEIATAKTMNPQDSGGGFEAVDYPYHLRGSIFFLLQYLFKRFTLF